LRALDSQRPNLEITSIADIRRARSGFFGQLHDCAPQSTPLLQEESDLARELANKPAISRSIDWVSPSASRTSISPHRGITAFTFHQDGRVEYRPAHLSEETLFSLEDNLLLFFTGYSRSASTS